MSGSFCHAASRRSGAAVTPCEAAFATRAAMTPTSRTPSPCRDSGGGVPVAGPDAPQSPPIAGALTGMLSFC